MRKHILAAFIIISFIAGISPSSAQKLGRADLDIRAKSGPQFGIANAFTEGEGVFVKWDMKSEVSIVGYTVFRTDFSGKQIVNKSLLIGSYGRYGQQIAYGETYSVFDPDGRIGSVYTIESIALNGQRHISRAFGTTVVKDLEVVSGTSYDNLITAAESSNRNIEVEKSVLTKELSQVVTSSITEPDLEMHQWVVSQPGAKIGVRIEGLYRVSASELASAGFPVESDTTTWRLFLDGIEQSIIIGGSSEYIEFYGKGIDTAESDTRVYYLISGSIPGKRVSLRALRPSSTFAKEQNYPTVAQKRERVSYTSRIFNGDKENYWGSIITSGTPVLIRFDVNAIDLSVPTSEITVTLQGFSFTDHRVRVRLNGNLISEMVASFHDNYSRTVTIPSSYLLEVNNVLELVSINPGDFSFFDTVSVNYARKYQASDNIISFFTTGYKKVDLTGFTSPDIRVFDITSDGNPTLFRNLPIVQDGDSYTVKLPSSRTMVSYAIEDSAILESPLVEQNLPSTLTSSTDGADLIIVSHSAADFLVAAESWADYRRNQGFTAKVVDIADVYDEFGYGVASSNALRSFLEHAYTNWQVTPKYVLLIGDGSYDPRNYEGRGYNNLIPTKSVRLVYEEAGSDEAMADFDNDGLAEMAIGRIPVRRIDPLLIIFNKTKAFENPSKQTFERGALFAHDLPIGFDFAGMNQILRNELPVSVPSVFISRSSPTAQSDLISQMSLGKLIINYSGHGSTGVWAASSFFGIDSVSQVSNGADPSIYTMLTCLNGYFLRPDADSLSESLLKSANGGAVAAWASSSETTPDVQLVMGTRFFNRLGSRTIPRLGDLVKDAKTSIPAGGDVRLSWALLGDPMLQVIAP